jgi:peptidoglycan/LPS O-acetylase OafA/YrhL
VSAGRRAGAACALAGVLLVVLDSVWHSQEIGSQLARGAIADAPAAAGFGLIVLGLVAAPGMGRWLASPPLRLLGTLSYGIYLWHYPIIRLLRAEKWWPMDLVPKFALVFGFCAVAAAFSWFCVERPALRWSARTIEKRRARAGRSAAKSRGLPAPARA